VDDNRQNCNLVAGMFIGSHHELEFGADGQEAITKVRTFSPDVLLMDVRMPNMDGYQVLEQLRRIPDTQLLPIIAVTASNLLDEQKGLQENFSGYLRKPFSRRELFNELAHFLPRHDKNETVTSRTTPAAPVSSRQTDALAGLVTKLRALEVEEWPSLRDSGAINETRAFAAKLEDLALKADSELLMTYAEVMTHYADSYAVDALEKHLQQFPSLIKRVEQSSE